MEGALANLQIWQSWMNFVNGTQLNLSTAMADFILANDKWVRSMADSQTTDPYWGQVYLVLQQFDGLLAGYNAYAPIEQQLTYLEFLAYQLTWELGDIAVAVAVEEPKHNLRYSPASMMGEHCSVLVKPSSDGQRLFASHDTWTGYTSMLRMWKTYVNPFKLSSTAAPAVTFSSYPGNIPSGDDYYITSSNMVIMETTNGVMNTSLYKSVTTNTVMYYIRVVVANRMASTGAEWAKYFALYNSGTYNNQYQVVDYKQFTPGNPLQPGTLWIVEQIPGYVVSADETSHLIEDGYWASYNIPFFPFVYNISGYPQYYKSYGNTYSYSHCARANIFRRDQGEVSTLEDMQRIMRYNEYQIDPLSLHDACRGISARCDLNPPWAPNTLNSYSAFGGVDSKITEASISNVMKTLAVSGPTWDAQAVFAWTNQWKYYPHFGHPNVFNFPWVYLQPSNVTQSFL